MTALNEIKPRLKMVPLCEVELFKALAYNKKVWTLRELLRRAPALCTEALCDEYLDRQLGQLRIIPWAEDTNTPLYRPRGMSVEPVEKDGFADETESAGEEVPDNQPSTAAPDEDEVDDWEQREDIPPRDAVRFAYSREIDSIASYLRANLPVLVLCDKLVVEHLWKEIGIRSRLQPRVLGVPDEGQLDMPALQTARQKQVTELRRLITDLNDDNVMVIPHLDLLAGGNNANLTRESGEFIELIYQASDRLVLAFADRTMDIPEVLGARFAVRILISGVSRTVVYPNGREELIGKALVTAKEAAHFQGYEPEGLYKNVAGMNPIRFRDAIKYADEQHSGKFDVPVDQLYLTIRQFKAQTSSRFEVPQVAFEDIGGYRSVKDELELALQLIEGQYDLPDESLRREMLPRGLIFYGPPGTGKTLFAKAIANRMKATIQIVAGPEVTDMYVGESERKVRELFAEARRNAPAVLVFDEFDSIASKRSGREDGGSRVGNALVAQILTEMDGFRPDVPMLVIGTTNRLDIIDEAMLRPSRFRAIEIGLPDLHARLAIARVHAEHFQIEVDEQLLDVIARSTHGLNGDDIRSLFRDACVGLHCQNRPADAERFGYLVGTLRRSAQQRAASASQRRRRALGARQPEDGLVPLTPTENDDADE